MKQILDKVSAKFFSEKNWVKPQKKPRVIGSNIVDLVGMPRRPDFYCVGTEKAGTTWIWHWMNKHPDIGVPASKELRFFDSSATWDIQHFKALTDFLENSAHVQTELPAAQRLSEQLRLNYGGIDAYLRIFGSMKQPVVGEVSPQYCIQPLNKIKEMYQAAPDAKIIYMLRDPVDRIISGSKMVVRRESNEVSDANILQNASSQRQRAFSNAALHLKNFEKFFGTDNVKVIFYDDVQSQPQVALNQMCEFLGVKPINFEVSDLTKRVNEGLRYDPSPGVRLALLKSLAPQYSALEKRFGEQVEKWKQKHLSSE